MTLGNLEYGFDPQVIDVPVVVEACGATGLQVERPEDPGQVIRQARGGWRSDLRWEPLPRATQERSSGISARVG
jgi:hypothetical protein